MLVLPEPRSPTSLLSSPLQSSTQPSKPITAVKQQPTSPKDKPHALASLGARILEVEGSDGGSSAQADRTKMNDGFRQTFIMNNVMKDRMARNSEIAEEQRRKRNPSQSMRSAAERSLSRFSENSGKSSRARVMAMGTELSEGGSREHGHSFSFAVGQGNSKRLRLREESFFAPEVEKKILGNLDPSPFQIREVRRAEVDLKNAPVMVPPPIDGHEPRTEEEELRERMRDNEYFDSFSKRQQKKLHMWARGVEERSKLPVKE